MGCSASYLKRAGFTLIELVAGGFDFCILAHLFATRELIAAGLGSELMRFGYGPARLAAEGLTAASIGLSSAWHGLMLASLMQTKHQLRIRRSVDSTD